MFRSALRAVAVCFALLASSFALRAQVVAYHDATSATHQTQFNTLSGQGYRIVSLSVAGGLSAPRYSAIWELVGGPGWVASHDMSAAQFTSTRLTWLSQGFRAKLVSVAGSGSDVVYAAVFVHDGAVVSELAAYGQSSLLTQVGIQRDQGRIPCSVDIYGPTASPLYYVVFEPNTAGNVWGLTIDATPTDFVATRNAHLEGGQRPLCLGMSESQRYISAWVDDRLDNIVVRLDNTSSQWQTTFTTWTGAGYYPRLIASGGSGTAERFSGMFAQQLAPLPRSMTTTGNFHLQTATLDTFVRNLLQNYGARGASLAVAKDGKLVYARAFTWAEAGYPITQPTDRFRIASCSKPLTAIATHRADQLGHLAMTTSPASALGLNYSDSRFANIDISHVLEFTSGIVRNYDAWTVANWLNPSSPTLPVTITQGAQWVAAQNLLYAPGTASSYSNAAFLLPAEVIRVRTGLTLQAWLQSTVLAPLGITRMKVAPSELGQLTSTDVFPHVNDLTLQPSELYSDRRRKSPQFAQDLNFKQASGGMASSTVDYVRLLAGIFDLKGADTIVLNPATVATVLARHSFVDHDDPTQSDDLCLGAMAWKPRPNGVFSYSKSGSLDSASAEICWRTDGISWALFVNKGDSGAGDTTVNPLIEAISSWPDVDEFPNYGLPAFPQRPEITDITPSSLPNMTTSAYVITGKRLDTVTNVHFGFFNVTSTSPTNWANGYFHVVSATELEFHPPQGQVPATLPLSVENSVGTSGVENVTLSTSVSYRLGAPTVVNPGQTWYAYASRGLLSGLSPSTFVILGVSFSNQPSTAPGIVDLGIGNQFADLLMTGAELFASNTNMVRFSLPALPPGSVWLQAMALDLSDPSIFPLHASNVVQVTRL